MSEKIKRIDSYVDERFDDEVLKQHGAFIVDEKYQCSFRIINKDSAIVCFDKEVEVLDVIDEFRFYSEHITNFYNENNELIKTFPEVDVFDIEINNIQPSQFFVDLDKVNAIETFIRDEEDIIIALIKKDDQFISLDGHTRLYYAVSKGYSKVKGFLTEADESIYGFVEEARKRNVFNPSQLILVPHDEYEIKWNKFCDDFFSQRGNLE
ncbi:MAG: hypothetical protein E6929_05840 [Clostridium sp.]|nr:hypothetical protein [Clostridium sp.]